MASPSCSCALVPSATPCLDVGCRDRAGAEDAAAGLPARALGRSSRPASPAGPPDPGALLDVLGVSLPPLAALGLGAIVADMLSPGSRPEVHVAIVSTETAHLQRVELVVADYQREGLRTLARAIERRRVRPGELRVLLLGEADPVLRVLELDALRRRIAARKGATS